MCHLFAIWDYSFIIIFPFTYGETEGQGSALTCLLHLPAGVSKVSSVLPDHWAWSPRLSCHIVTSPFSMVLSVEEYILAFICMFMLASFCQYALIPVLEGGGRCAWRLGQKTTL